MCLVWPSVHFCPLLDPSMTVKHVVIINLYMSLYAITVLLNTVYLPWLVLIKPTVLPFLVSVGKILLIQFYNFNVFF